MTQPPFISADDLATLLDWPSVISAIRSGHRLRRTVPQDTLIEYGNNHLLTRSCVIEGLGSGAKVVGQLPTITGFALVGRHPANAGLVGIQSG